MEMENENKIENQRSMELEEKRSKKNANSANIEKKQENQASFINGGEATLLLATTSIIEIIQWAFDFILYLGWLINILISVLVGLCLFVWVTGKITKGAPKSWYKTIYLGAIGGAIPVIPGYLGAIIYLLMQDRKIFGEVGTKIITKMGK